MRTIAFVLVVFSIGVAVTMVTASGFAGVWGAEPPQSQVAQEELQNASNSSNPNADPIQGPVSSGESSLTGIIVDGFSSIFDFAGAVVALPATLMDLGFPGWFAKPVGRIAQLIAGIGGIQFATGREWT